MSKKVIVTDISEKASEKTVKDFFLFCGKIKEFELIKEESSDKQIAYITFEKDTAAKTALMLTNAVICDSQITVKSADDASFGDDIDDSSCTQGQEEKPKAIIFAEILAAGYILQDAIIERGIEFDLKYGVSECIKQYLAQLQANRTLNLDFVKTIDEKYCLSHTVTSRATDLGNKFAVYEGAKYVINQAQDKAHHFLGTPTGKMIFEYFYTTQQKVADVQVMARKIADEKKNDRNYNPVPSHSHSDVSASNSPISAQ